MQKHTLKAVRITNHRLPFDENGQPLTDEVNVTYHYDRNDPYNKGLVIWDENSTVSETHFFGSVKVEVLEHTQDLILR